MKRQRTKTRYIAFVAATIDGRISLYKKTPPTWTSEEDWGFLQKSLTQADAVIVVRNTYHAAAKHLRKRVTYVFSRRLSALQKRGSVTFLNPARADLAGILECHTTVAILGGASVYGWCLKHQLLDELYVTIEPLVFGRGAPMIEAAVTTQFRLVSVRVLNIRGTVLLHYKIFYDRDCKTNPHFSRGR